MPKRQTIWERKLIARLRAMKDEDETYNEFGERVGLDHTMANKILAGRRGIGPTTLERIRQAQPALVSEVFLPEEDTIVV